jgi:hypothetical protein
LVEFVLEIVNDLGRVGVFQQEFGQKIGGFDGTCTLVYQNREKNL